MAATCTRAGRGFARWSADYLAGLVILVVSITVATPVLFGNMPTAIPLGAWAAVLIVFVAAGHGATMWSGKWAVALYVVAVISAWVLVMSAPNIGFLTMLLVTTAALGTYIAPMWMTVLVVVANSAVVMVATNMTGQGAATTWLTVGFILLIQVASALQTSALVREQRMRRQLAAANVALSATGIERTENARTAERLRISRELHDAVGHQLTVLTLQLETAKHVDDAAVREHLARADATARELLSEVRRAVGDLRSERVELEPALKQLTSDLPGLDVTLDISPDLMLDDAGRFMMLRAAQEIVTNALRHGGASKLLLRLTNDRDGALLVGRDNGEGAQTIVLGNGLRGITERVEALGGRLSVAGESGFEVQVRLP